MRVIKGEREKVGKKDTSQHNSKTFVSAIVGKFVNDFLSLSMQFQTDHKYEKINSRHYDVLRSGKVQRL